MVPFRTHAYCNMLLSGQAGRTSRWFLGSAVLGISGALFLAIVLGLSVEPANGSIPSPQWIRVSIPAKLQAHRVVVLRTGSSEFLYVIGGYEDGTSVSNKVYFSQLNPAGELGNWTDTTPMGKGLQEHSAVAVGGRIYVLGGRGKSWKKTYRTVYCAKPDATGAISGWIPVTKMPIGLRLHSAVVVDNMVFVIGGYNQSKRKFVDKVWAADITGGECTSLQWRTQSEEHLPRPLAALSAVAVQLDNGRKFVYVIGGYDKDAHKRVYRTEVTGTYTLTPWVSLGDIEEAPTGFFRHVSVISGRYLYVIGGITKNSGLLKGVYRARIEDDGGLGPWSSLEEFPVAVRDHAAVGSASGRVYVLGGEIDSEVIDWGYYAPIISLKKLASPVGTVAYGDTIAYTLTLTNLGVRDFQTLDITDTIRPSPLATIDFHSVPTDCRVRPDITNTITCTIPSLGLGARRDLSFAVTISTPASALHSAPSASHLPVAASSSLLTRTWTQECDAARLEVVGVGISGTLTDTLYITDPATIIDDIRVQVAFKVDPGEELGEVIFSSGGITYSMTSPTSAYSCTAVYEQDVVASDTVSVAVDSVDREKARALTAYYLRVAEDEYSLSGSTMNRFLYGKLYTQTYTHVLKLPVDAHSGDVSVKAVITDNDHPDRAIRLGVRVGENLEFTRTTTFTEPTHGECLDIRELQLSGIPSTTSEITVVAQSPLHGESFGLIGLVAEAGCTSAPEIVRVSNHAEVCERSAGGTWCWHTGYINTDRHAYLPLVLRNPP